MQTTIGARHIYTQELVKLLQTVKVGEIVTYEQMEAAIGLQTRPSGEGYSYQRQARSILERDFSIVFDVVETVGLQRLSIEQVAASTASMYVQKKKSIIRKHKQRIGTLDDSFEQLTPEGQMKTTLARTLLAFDAEVVKRKRVNEIESHIGTQNKLIGFQETIGLFTNGP